jgi:hypothetical protein
MGSCLSINMHNMILNLTACGYPIADAYSPTTKACITWCHNTTTKGSCHIELQESITREWVNKGAIMVSHVSGKSNPNPPTFSQRR